MRLSVLLLCLLFAALAQAACADPAFARGALASAVGTRSPATPEAGAGADPTAGTGSAWQLCAGAIAAAERSQRTPEHLLDAIGRVESGRVDARTGLVRPWPWTINAEGLGRFFDSKADAIVAVQALQARGVRSIDIGCMQVNLMYHPGAFASLDEAFDPPANARYAARFLASLYHDLGTWPRAAGAYHSQTADIGADYERKVMAVWGHPLPPLPPLPPAPPSRFAAFGPVDPQFRAFAPDRAIFAAFTDPATLPATLHGYAGLPARTERARRPRR